MKTISHSKSYGGCERPLSDILRAKDESGVGLGEIVPRPALRNDGKIPCGARGAMFAYLVALRNQFAEQGMTEIVADIDLVFHADNVVRFLSGAKVSTPKSMADAAALGRQGGLKGGPARREAMTPEQRKASASHAAKARWALQRKAVA